MELVYKKDGFIFKLFACLFISLFIIFCLIGNSVYASDNETISICDNNFYLPSWVKKYNFVCFYSISDNNYFFNFYLTTADSFSLTIKSDYYIFNTRPIQSFGKTASSKESIQEYINSNLNDETTFINSLYSGDGVVRGYFSPNSVNTISTCDVSLTNGDINYTQISTERGATGDSNYDSYINGLIGSNGGNLSDIASDITNGDIGNSVENSDKTSIFNISQKLGSGFSKIFGFFNFIDTVKNSIVDIYNLLINTTEAPKLYMTFNHQYIQGEQCILDLSWYTPYKELGDGIICAFMYACFMWHVFSNLYNIISGQNSVVSSAESYMTSSVPGVVSGK